MDRLRKGCELMEIRLEKRHIDNGQSGKAFNCPLALACKDAGFERASVARDSFYLDFPDGKQFATDGMVDEFMNNFDHGMTVHPGTIEIYEDDDISYVSYAPDYTPEHHWDDTDEKCSCNCTVWVCAECGKRECEFVINAMNEYESFTKCGANECDTK